MDDNQLLNSLAPCGLDCSRCLANPDSPISRLSQTLRRELGNFSALAERFALMDPLFGEYRHFDRILNRLAEGSCSGCRTGQCLLSTCRVKDCVRKQQVDFCFQCRDFPCDRTGLPEALHQRWLKNNTRMQDIGPEAFFREIQTFPRY